MGHARADLIPHRMMVMANPAKHCADESGEAGAAPADGTGKKTDLQQHLQVRQSLETEFRPCNLLTYMFFL